MNRRVWLVIAVFATLTLALGTGGFSTASIDRGVSMSVADHEDAYVGLADPGAHGTQPDWMPPEYSSETPVTENDRSVRLFVVRNGLGEGQLRVTARNADTRGVRLIDAETAWVGVDTGPEVVNGTVECPEDVHGPTPLELTVVVDGAESAFHAEIDYSVTVVCPPAEAPPTSSPTSEPASTTPTPELDTDDGAD